MATSIPVPESFGFVPAANRSEDAQRMTQWLNRYIDDRTDPASKAPGAPPMYGQDNVPHVLTFSSLIGSFSRAYMNPDQAVMESIDNAHKMTQDLSLTECIENRKRLTALLEGEVVPEDKDNPYQVAVGESLAKMMDRIRNFTEYKMWLMDAIWVGRSGIQHRYGWENINGRQRLIPKSQHADDPGWAPIKGDKLVFRYDDGRLKHGEYAHQCGIRVAHNFGVVDRLGRERKLEPVGDGLAVFLKPWERNTMTIHKHMIEDADFHYSHFAGSLHGVGIRSKIYWTWWLKQEALAFMMQYLERSAGGTEIFTYPSGDDKALAQVKQAAMEKSANGRNVIFFPRPPGEDAMAYDYNVVENGMMGLDMMKDLVENYFGGQIKRYILGQQMSTEAHSTGMNSGVSDAHMDTLQQLVRYDACGLSDTLTDQTLRYLQLVNYPETAGWRFRYRLKTDDNDAMARLDAARAAYEMGCKIAEKDVMQIVGLGSPRDGDNVLDVAKSGGGGGMPGLPPDGDGDGLRGQAEVLDDRQHESAGIEQYYRRRVERALAR